MADNQVTIVLKAIDKATGDIRKVEASLKHLGGASAQVGGVLGAMTNLFAGGLTTAGTILNLLVGTVKMAGRVISSVFHAIVSVVEKVIDTIAGLGTKLLWVAGIAAGVMAAIAYKIGKSALSLAGWMQQTRIAFTTMLGDPHLADMWIAKFRKMAFELPFTFRGVVDAVRQLIAYGFNIRETPRWITAISDAAAAFGGTQEQIDRITMAIGQIRTMGFPSGQEMRQLAQAGLPVWEMLSQGLGKTQGEVMKLAETRMITAQQALGIILGGIEKRYAGMSKKMMDTLPGALSNLQDVWEASLMKLGAPLANVATKIIKSLSDTLWGLAESGALEKIGDKIAAWFSPENIKRTLNFFANIYAAGVKAFGWIRNAWETFIEKVTDRETVKGFMAIFANIYAAGKVMFLELSEDIKIFLDGLKGVFATLWKILKIVAPGVAGLLETLFTKTDEETAALASMKGSLQERFAEEALTTLMAGYDKTVGIIRGLTSTTPTGAMGDLINTFTAGLSTELAPLIGTGEKTAQNTAEIAENTEGLLDKIYGGADYAKSVLTRMRFGAAPKPMYETPRPASQFFQDEGGGWRAVPLRKRGEANVQVIQLSIDVKGGDNYTQNVARQAAEQSTSGLLSALGISTGTVSPAMRGATA